MKKKILYWTPRVLCVLSILFVMLFSVDVFEMEATLGQKLLGFLMHNIPSLILMALLGVAWKWELIGGIIFLCIAVAMSFFLTDLFTRNFGVLTLCAPFLLVGGLFLWYWFLYKKGKGKAEKAAN